MKQRLECLKYPRGSILSEVLRMESIMDKRVAGRGDSRTVVLKYDALDRLSVARASRIKSLTLSLLFCPFDDQITG